MKPGGKRKRPTHLGRYELIEEIGRGGMGVIFKGHDPRHDREVAIKVLPKQGAEDTERVARFKREVQTIAMLSHQGVVRIYDVGEDEGRYYFVMEYVEGQSVKAAVADKGIAMRRGLEIIEQMCRAIGRHGAALEQSEIALGLAPDHPVIVFSHGLSLEQGGRAAEAERSYRHALELRPDSFTRLDPLVTACKEAGRPDRAVDALRSFVDSNPDEFEARLLDHRRQLRSRRVKARRRRLNRVKRQADLQRHSPRHHQPDRQRRKPTALSRFPSQRFTLHPLPQQAIEKDTPRPP